MRRRLKCNGQPERGGALGTLVFALSAFAFLGLFYLVRGPIFRLVAGVWLVEDGLEPAEAIIVLSDDNYYGDRAARAAQLYRQGFASVVVASGRKLRPQVGVAELMEHDLLERGVPKEHVLAVPHRAESTLEEAEVMLGLARQRKWRSVIVVTSNYHTRRARYIYCHVFPATFRVRVASARDGDFDPERWWEKRVSVKRFATEIVGMAVAMWECRGKRPVETGAGRWPGMESKATYVASAHGRGL